MNLAEVFLNTFKRDNLPRIPEELHDTMIAGFITGLCYGAVGLSEIAKKSPTPEELAIFAQAYETDCDIVRLRMGMKEKRNGNA